MLKDFQGSSLSIGINYIFHLGSAIDVCKGEQGKEDKMFLCSYFSLV